MGLEGTASLIVAAFELSAVRLIRDAIRTADIHSGRGISAHPLGPDPQPRYLERRHIEPTPVFEPRVHIQPAPTVEPPIVRYLVEPASCGCTTAPAVAGAATACPESDPMRPPRQRAIPPVWATLPPVEPAVPFQRPVKRVKRVSDIRSKGIVIDVHI